MGDGTQTDPNDLEENYVIYSASSRIRDMVQTKPFEVSDRLLPADRYSRHGFASLIESLILKSWKHYLYYDSDHSK